MRNVDVLVTSRAAWISSLRTTRTPRPREAGLAAVRTALTMFISASVERPLSGALRTHDRHGNGDLQRQAEKIGRLLERRCAVADDDAGKILVFGDQPFAERAERFPFGEVDRRARNSFEADADNLGDFVDAGACGENRVGFEHRLVDGVVENVERTAADRRNRSAGADERDLPQHAVLAPRPPDPSSVGR